MTETQDYDKSADPTHHASNHESGGSDPIDNLGPLTGLTISGDGVITWQGASTSSIHLFDLRVIGDTYPRFRIRSDGRLEFSSGSSDIDTTWQRQGSHVFSFDGTIKADWGAYISRYNSLTYASYSTGLSGLSIAPFIVELGGKLRWGLGSAATDCEISRRAANILNTPDRFEAGTIGVANSANATTPGNCQKKIEIFDAAGNSLGFIAVYDAIT